jgi:hypothetical protein
VALHAASSNGFTANITINGEVRTDDASLTQIADEALAKLERTVGRVQLGRRNEVGSPENPGLTQAVRTSVQLNGRPREVVQLQVFLGMRDVRGEQRRAVLHIVLTATPEQFEQVIGDFQKFLATVRPDQGDAR